MDHSAANAANVKLDQVLTILTERSPRLDRLEAGLAVLAKQVSAQAVIRPDRCGKHANAPGGDCVGCVLVLNEENRKVLEFLMTGISTAADMLHRSRNLARDVGQVRNLLLGLLKPAVASKKCQFCDVEIEHVIAPGAVPTGSGVYGIEGLAFNPDTLEQTVALVCHPCSLQPRKPVQAPAPKKP